MRIILVITGLVLVHGNDGIRVDDFITNELIAELSKHDITHEQLRKYLEHGSLEVYAVLYGIYKILNVEPPGCLAADDHLQEYLHRRPDYDDKILDSIMNFVNL